MAQIKIEIPFPPSVNHYYRRVGTKTMISRSGRQYREDVSKVVWLSKSIPTPQSGKLAVALVAHPPDIRRRDLDNLLKASLDSLTHAGVWVDDSQIKALSIEWGNVVAGGRLDVVVSFFKEDDK